MKIFDIFHKLGLQVFAEGGDAGAGGTANGTGVNAAAAGSQNKGVKSNSLADVKYGIQEGNAPAAEVQKAEPANADSEFDKLIRGQYKAQYDAKVQDTIRNRLKGKDTQIADLTSKQTALEPLLEVLYKKHGVESGDIAALTKAIEADDSYFEEEALRKGMSVKQLKEFRAVEKSNEALRKQVAEAQQKKQAEAQYGAWMQQAEEAKKVYNSFDLKTEMGNGQFLKLLNSGIDVKTAYEVVHMGEIIPAAMQFAAKTMETNTAKAIASGANRPRENGMGSSSPALVKSDVSQLSKADRQEIIRRVQRGEKIRF